MKKELLKRILGGLGSLFKDRGKYFDPTSQNFGEVSTLLKGAPKNRIATEAQVMQRMMADPKYTSFRKSVLGETAEDDALENLQTMILGKDPAVINPDSARGRKMMREMQFFPKEKQGITSAKAVEEESDRILKAMRDMETQSKNMLTESTFLLDEQKLKNEAVDMFMREIEDGFEPTAALERMIRKIKLARTKQADGGRVGMKLGGLSSKGLNYLLDPKLRQDIKELLLMRPKANMGMDPAKTADMQQAVNVIRDPRTDLERILKDRADGTKATPLDTMTIRELEQMVQDSPRYNDEQKAVFFKLIDKEKIRANHFYNTGEELPDDMLEMLYQQGEGDFNQGGRVGMFAGGSLIGKGIMEAAKLAARGVKPFGAKQTYKQNVKNMGLSNFDQVEIVTSKQIDELRNANDVDGLFEMLEDVVSGKKFGMANPAQRKVLQENIEEALNDIPLNRDSRERLSEDYFNMMEYYKPDPKETGKVIPFKPRDKKAKGGLMSLLRAMGMKAPDKIADKKQIENVIRDPKTELERRYTDDLVTGTPATPKNQPTIDEIRDMIQKDPRYNKLTRAQMDMVVRRETIRADFAYNMGVKPEEVGDDIVDMLLMEGYDKRFGFNMGGLIPPQKGPMSEGMGTLYRRK